MCCRNLLTSKINFLTFGVSFDINKIDYGCLYRHVFIWPIMIGRYWLVFHTMGIHCEKWLVITEKNICKKGWQTESNVWLLVSICFKLCKNDWSKSYFVAKVCSFMSFETLTFGLQLGDFSIGRSVMLPWIKLRYLQNLKLFSIRISRIIWAYGFAKKLSKILHTHKYLF